MKVYLAASVHWAVDYNAGGGGRRVRAAMRCTCRRNRDVITRNTSSFPLLRGWSTLIVGRACHNCS